MSDIIKEWGLKLLLTKLKLTGDPLEFFRQLQIKSWNLQSNCSSGIKVYKDVLWMRLFEMSEGIKLPNGCKFFTYVPFWGSAFQHGKKFYRFRKAGSKVWEYHSFDIDEGDDILNER